MAIYNFTDNKFDSVEKTNFTDEKILERIHIQAALKQNIEIISPDCMIISEEFSEWTNSQKRIDLLAIDKNANIVVIELKRTETGEHMELQAVRYAAMVSTLTFRKTVSIYEKYLIKERKEEIQPEEEILKFLEWDEPQEDNFNNDVRIILVSANFSKELTTSVLWLIERNIDIKCVRMIPYKLENKLLVDIQQIMPLPEAEDYQVKIREKVDEQRKDRLSDRDYTKYRFEGKLYNKRKLVLAVIQHWIKKNQPKTFEDLINDIPHQLRQKKGNLFRDYEIIKEKKLEDRYFTADEELINLDSKVYAISNQWGIDNIVKFIQHFKEKGIEISEE